MNFPHWSSRLNFFLCFYYLLIFSIIFRRCPLSVWKFACGFSPLGCLPATAEKKRKKTGNRSLARYYCACCVYARRRELYYSISLFSFSCFVILISRWWDAATELPMCEFVRNCYAFTTYCCFSSLFLSSTDLKAVLVAHASLYFSSLLSGWAFPFFPKCYAPCKYS